MSQDGTQAESAEIRLEAPPSGKDFTIFRTIDAFPERVQKELKAGRAYSANVDLTWGRTGRRRSGRIIGARALICPCFSRALVSATFRHNDELTGDGKANWKKIPSIVAPPREPPKERKVSIPFELLVGQMQQLIFGKGGPRDGLIVFSGTTQCGKTQISKGLVLRYLWKLREKQDKRAHLVTYEDPVEDWTFAVGRKRHRLVSLEGTGRSTSGPTAWVGPGYGVDFTPRQGGQHDSSDCSKLGEALLDAKRQTPACFYVGEVRSEDDWKAVLEFAGSGHLVVVTTHASSLVETFSRILSAVHATTPALRRIVAAQVLACIHLQAAGWRDGKAPKIGANRVKPPILPSIWLRHGQAVNALTGDGLASICPNGSYVISRSQFAQGMDLAKWCGNPAGIKSQIINAGRDADMKELLG